ncbi:MAG: hypothetical protein ACMXYL_00215 [Candidatus Woesearchaeota archaeon]
MKAIILLAVIALAIAGCNDDTQPAPIVIDDNELVIDDSVPKTPEQNVVESSGDNALNQELAGLMRRQMTMNYHIEYDMKISSGPVQQDMKATYYVSSDGRIRVDTLMQGIESRSYVLGDNYYTCTLIMGAWNCMDYSSIPVGDSVEQVDEESIAIIEQGVVSRLPPKTVAGVTSNCYRAVIGMGTMDYCYTPEGIPVYVKSMQEFEGMTTESEMIATSISRSIPSGVFDLPSSPTAYEDMDYEDLIKQYQMQ